MISAHQAVTGIQGERCMEGQCVSGIAKKNQYNSQRVTTFHNLWAEGKKIKTPSSLESSGRTDDRITSVRVFAPSAH